MAPRPFIEYLTYFHTFRDYFECHEVLEEHWKEEGQQNKLWVGYIQLAVAMYHHRRNNFPGAKKQLSQAVTILEMERKQSIQLGIDIEALLVKLRKKLSQITNKQPYTPINIPINSQELIEKCREISQEKGSTWGKEIGLISSDIIHKHKLRDRTEIIAEREYQLKKRMNAKKEGN
ncbi:DUF309 domain-containing protein [Anaerobacillus alkaliphilus]|uniref:DUF309 domain-containing protein n=1 Tax=Anaerobacillus alkaliphilus TaxID=1548597 RepID=A0A4Q0VVY0_9BACI|nr:DUF309 domain-containing protein [Anaerobacillus alkaliphilus]RXJ03857.1 DUF309 domain-containing protein [Anaerobacillus alkaliphilus]